MPSSDGELRRTTRMGVYRPPSTGAVEWRDKVELLLMELLQRLDVKSGPGRQNWRLPRAPSNVNGGWQEGFGACCGGKGHLLTRPAQIVAGQVWGRQAASSYNILRYRPRVAKKWSCSGPGSDANEATDSLLSQLLEQHFGERLQSLPGRGRAAGGEWSAPASRSGPTPFGHLLGRAVWITALHQAGPSRRRRRWPR